MIEIKVVNDTVTPALHRLALAGQRLSPLMRTLAGIMHNAVEENFAQGGRPAWEKLKNPRPERKGKKGKKKKSNDGQILVDSARLKNSVRPFSNAREAAVGTNVKYAAIHQFGGITKPHVIRARDAKALHFGGRFAKSVKHPGSDIPARPFLQMTPDEENKIIRKVENYLLATVDRSTPG